LGADGFTFDARRQPRRLGLRGPFQHLGTRIYPDMFSLARENGAATPLDGPGRQR
jgi:hypothetical protein